MRQRQVSPPSEPGRAGEGAELLFAALIGEESRLAVGAKLAWARYARETLTGLAQTQPRP